MFADTDISDGGSGEYQTSFDTGTAGWNAGPVTVSFIWKGAGSMRALPTGFNLNKLATTLVTNEMRGTIEWASRAGGGTSVVIEARLRAPRDARDHNEVALASITESEHGLICFDQRIASARGAEHIGRSPTRSGV